MENRKYFDYELAYEGYKKALELFNKGGIQAILDSGGFSISGGDSIGDWIPNGYIILYGCGYNTSIVLRKRNFDVDTGEVDWYVSGEVDVYSYSSGNDNLYINSIDSIKERIINLVDYAKNNNYTLDDVYKEYESLEKVLKILESEEKKYGKQN